MIVDSIGSYQGTKLVKRYFHRIGQYPAGVWFLKIKKKNPTTILTKQFKDTNLGESLGFGSAIPVIYVFHSFLLFFNCYGDWVRWEIYYSFVQNEEDKL